MTDIRLPAELHHMDEDERALAAMPSLDDRMKYHTKRLRSIAYISGAEGLSAYKSKHPEARTLLANPGNPSVSRTKPAGFDTYLANLAARWLSSDTALAATNIADVQRMNAHFATTRFNPAKQFSLALGKRAKAAIEQAFNVRGFPLDTSAIKTMSDVRKAAKAANARIALDRQIAPGVTVSDGKLTMGCDTYAITHNGGRECIRPRINGKVRRLHLDEIGWLAGRLAKVAVAECRDDPLSYPSIEDMGERDYFPETATLPSLADARTGECDYSPYAAIGERDCSPSSEAKAGPAEPLSLTERIAALKPDSPAHAADPDADPLALS